MRIMQALALCCAGLTAVSLARSAEANDRCLCLESQCEPAVGQHMSVSGTIGMAPWDGGVDGDMIIDVDLDGCQIDLLSITVKGAVPQACHEGARIEASGTLAWVPGPFGGGHEIVDPQPYCH